MFHDIWFFRKVDWDLAVEVGTARRDINTARRASDNDNSDRSCSLKDDIIGALAEVAFHRMIGLTPVYDKMVLSAEEFAKTKHLIADVVSENGTAYEIKSVDKPHFNLVVNEKGHTKSKQSRTFVLVEVNIRNRTALAVGWSTGEEVSEADLVTDYQSPHFKILRKNLHSMSQLP